MYRIAIGVPKLWNDILNKKENLIVKPTTFKATTKPKFVLLENNIVCY